MTTKAEKYNGWTNRATWNVALWFANDEPLYRAQVAASKGRKKWTADDAEAFAREHMGEATPDGDKLDDVPVAGWREIARAWSEDCD